jgi:hypothetical protein
MKIAQPYEAYFECHHQLNWPAVTSHPWPDSQSTPGASGTRTPPNNPVQQNLQYHLGAEPDYDFIDIAFSISLKSE